MKEILKPWQGWLLFGFAMAIVFALGVVISFLTERRPEVVNAVYRKKIEITGIEARSSLFSDNYQREYKTWGDTTSTDSHGGRYEWKNIH